MKTDFTLVPSINHYTPFAVYYDLAPDMSTFLKRGGISGKFGRKSVIISLLKAGEEIKLREFERELRTNIRELPCDLS